MLTNVDAHCSRPDLGHLGEAIGAAPTMTTTAMGICAGGLVGLLVSALDSNKEHRATWMLGGAALFGIVGFRSGARTEAWLNQH